MRNRFSFLFALIALVAVALPQGAHAGTPVPQTYSCGAGSFLVGFQGHTGNWIDSFQPICAPWDPVHRILGPQVAGPAFGNINGGSPNLSVAVCPSMSGLSLSNVIRGIEYESTFPNGPPGHLQHLKISCADVITGMPYGPTYQIGPDDPDKNNSEGVDPCPGTGLFSEYPAPLVAYGLTINLDGINIASVSLECDRKENIEAAAGPGPVHITAEEALRAHGAFSAPPPVHTTPGEALRARVAWNQPPASAPVPGSWYQSCSNASLYQNVLTASCKSTTGLNVTSSLNLTTCNQPASAANINGMLVCQSGVASTSRDRHN